MILIPVPLGERAYDVRIGRFEPAVVADALATAVGEATGVAVLVDAQVARLSPRVAPLAAALEARFGGGGAASVPVRRFDLAPGEGCKSLAEVHKTVEWMAAAGFDRGALVLAIGGGAASDHAGFAAAIYLRGVRFAICPTTLLAIVDLAAGKNLVGAFHQPRAVVADLGFLATLPARERVAGLAEVVKSGLIADAALFERLESDATAIAASVDDPALAAVIAAAVQIKADVVTEDERESGRRAILNFGHTVGHAVETASGYDLLHGEAVSLGMVAALSLGVSLGVTPPEVRDRARTLLARLGLPVDVERRLTPEVLAHIDVDKKRRGKAVRFVLVGAPGTCVLRDIPIDELRGRLDRTGA